MVKREVAQTAAGRLGGDWAAGAKWEVENWAAGRLAAAERMEEDVQETAEGVAWAGCVAAEARSAGAAVAARLSEMLAARDTGSARRRLR